MTTAGSKGYPEAALRVHPGQKWGCCEVRSGEEALCPTLSRLASWLLPLPPFLLIPFFLSFPALLTERTWLVIDKTTNSPGSRGKVAYSQISLSLIAMGQPRPHPLSLALVSDQQRLSEEHLLRGASGHCLYSCHNPRNASTPASFLSWRLRSG